MEAEVRRKTFSQHLETLRRQGRRPDLSEIARLGLKSGLTSREILLEIQDFLEYRHTRSGEIIDALALFITSHCVQTKSTRVLEYASTPSLLTLGLTEHGKGPQLTYISPDPHVAGALQELFRKRLTQLIRIIPDVSLGAQFDAIICQPPIGHKPSGAEAADGFGGEVVMQLAPFLAKGGILYWVTGRGVLFAPLAKKTLSDLDKDGLRVLAAIEVAPAAFPSAKIEGAVIALRREVPVKKFVGAIRDLETAQPMASALIAGPVRKDGLCWTWLERDDQRTFADLEQARLLRKLIPRGRHELKALGSLLTSDSIIKADKPIENEAQAAAFLFIPEYAGSRVTAELDKQTVKPNAVYRFSVDPAKANPHFLTELLNSPYGKQLRASAAQGATIQRMSAAVLRSLELPIPDLAIQGQIARIESDLGLLQAAFSDMQETIGRDWTTLSDVAGKVDGLKAVLDIERRIANWWQELPYPLATIYRRYQVTTDPKEGLDTLLHFFEMAAVYLATIGTSHVKLLRQDWQSVIAKWFHPAGAAGIERADFGLWISLAGASLKDVSRVASDKELRVSAIEMAGPELVQIAETIGPLGKATEVLDVVRRCRNLWKGHGGYIKPSDAERLDNELQQSIRDFYEITSSLFRRFQLVRPGKAAGTDTGLKFEIEKLSGSDPTFEKEQVELDRIAKTNALAFWMSGARTICRALPFFRLGAPQRPQETSFYVFNRVENGRIRWVSYQETQEQEVFDPDDELFGIINLGKEGA